LSKTADRQEEARVLWLDQPAADVPPRKEPSSLKPVELSEAIGEQISRLLADPRGQYVLAVTHKNFYYFIETGAAPQPRVHMVTIAGGSTITTSCLAGAELYAIVGPAAKLFEIEPATGAVGRTWDLGSARPYSLAVLPSKQSAFFPDRDHIQRLNMTDGSIDDTDEPGQVLAGDPSEQFVYTRFKDQKVSSSRTILINGHPIFISGGNPSWNQTALLRYFVAPDRLLIAAVRLNASSNGFDAVVSPDGRWVSVPGGGGWRPESGQGGYKIPVFVAADLGIVRQNFFLDAYPQGCAFNPVTQEFVGIRTQDAKVFHLATETPDLPATTLAGNFSGVATWSGNGVYLFLAGAETGLSVYQEELTAAEIDRSREWWTNIHPKSVQPAAAQQGAGVATTPKMIESLKTYQPATNRDELAKSVADAIASTANDKPLPWRQIRQYVANADSVAAIDSLSDNSQIGVHIFMLRQSQGKDSKNAALSYYLAHTLKESGQSSGAKTLYLNAIRVDAGQSEITTRSLMELADLVREGDQDVSAADCYSNVLILDRNNADAARRLIPLLEKLDFQDQAKKLAEIASGSAPETAPPRIGELPLPRGLTQKMTPAAVFRRAARSVVLIRCGDTSGSGVCIEPGGIVLTSLHVVAGKPRIEVYAYVVEDGKTRRLPRCSAEMVASSADDDLAILRVHNPPPMLMPLLVASDRPATGTKVFAIGNPGWEDTTLEMTFSDGVVSAAERMVNGNKYLQHSAAVNPGNSGGPLLNDSGMIIGLVCIKSDLEGVGFATPADVIREMVANAAKHD
jgi:hypothetical protein